MRVACVADTDGWGGAEIWLGHHLRRAAGHGVDVRLVCTDTAAPRFAAWVAPSRLTAVRLARHRPAAPDTARALAQLAPDVVLVNLVDPASNAATLEAAVGTAPSVGVLHLAGDVRSGGERRRLAGLYADLELAIGTSTQAERQVLEELAEPRQGTAVVCNGVDIPAVPRGPAGHTPPRVGVHGRLTAQKGFDVLLAAVRLLVDRGVALEVVIGGAGRDEQVLRAAAEGLPVSFPGWVSDHRAFLAGLDVFCLSSRHDALPLSLSEAMAEGLPCVATDIGDVGLRVGDAVALVPPEEPAAMADAVQALLVDPARRADLGRAARAAAVGRLDADTMVAHTFRLIRDVVARAAADERAG